MSEEMNKITTESEPQEGTVAEKPDIFDFLQSQPDVEDPFEPSEPTPEPVQEEKSEAEMIVDYIRMRSGCGVLTAKKAFLTETEDEEEREVMRAILEKLPEDERFADIRTEIGQKDIYYYSTPTMAVNYAHMAMLAEEKDLPRTIADIVRWQCKIGPAPTPFVHFTYAPYRCTKEEIAGALEVMASQEQYKDIRQTQSYNGVTYLYSSNEISAKYAKALADYSEESAEIQ